MFWKDLSSIRYFCIYTTMKLFENNP